MPPIVQGQIFPTLADFKIALRDWAIERNWTPHILDSDSHRVRAGCRSAPDCPFRIRANYSAKRNDAKVTTCDDNHTCEPFRASADGRAHQDIKRAETGKLKFLLEAVPRLMTVTLDTNILEIIDAVERKYGQKIPTRQAQKVKSNLTDRVKGPCRQCHQLGHTRRRCPQLRDAAPGPLTFNALQHELSNFAGQDNEDGAYADGGLELDSGNDTAPGPENFTNGQQPHGHQPNDQLQRAPPSGGFSQPYQLVNGIPVDPNLASRIQRLNSGDGPVVMQPAITHERSQHERQPQNQGPVQNSATIRSPQETRIEAARLMQRAADLMQEAARLNSEAARLTLSVASAEP
ncbi:hypothetical protein P7C71_g3399, partial [Lecanoromycetidae sp. Uapishka_2]